MGKLTGLSSQPPESGAKNKPNGQQQNNNDEGGTVVTSTATESMPTPQQSPTGSVSGDDTANNNMNSHLRISFNNNRRQNSNKRSQKHSEFSSSMITAVNNAAQTARLVLDKAASEIMTDDNRSDGSSVASILSFNSHRSSSGTSIMNELGMDDCFNDDIIFSGSGDIDIDDNDDAKVLQGEDNGNNTDINSNNPLFEGSTHTRDSFIQHSDASEDILTPFSPPPANAFQNLPMTRGFTPTHKLSSDNTNKDVLADGTYEVTTHFDAAAAISAALASSHLAHATSPMSCLKHAYPAIKRRSSAGEEGRDALLEPTRLRRSASGSAADEMYSLLMKTASKEEDEDDGGMRRRSAGLPTREEAEAEMLSNRTSFVSVDDLSFGSDDAYDESMKLMMEAYQNQQSQIAADKKLSNINVEMKIGTGDPKAEGETKKVEPSPNVKQVVTAERTVVAKMKSDDSTSHCSSSGFENESNTSSYTDISPISMSTGGDSGASKQNGNNNTQKGVLGNLANSRRKNAALETSIHSYEGADDEYSTNSENSGLPRGGDLPRQGSGKDKDVKSKSTGTVISSKPIPERPMMSMSTIVGSSNRKPHGMMFKGGSVSAQTDEPNTSSADIDDYVAASPKENPKQLSVEQSRHVAPSHRISLFDSFDRNWEQTVHQKGSDNPEKELASGRKCFAAFAIVFGSCNDANGRPIFGDTTNDNNSDNAKEISSSFRWWVDDNALTNAGDIRHRPNPANEGVSSEQEEDLQGIPIVVIRSLWKVCFFDAEENAEGILDAIQHTLVKELCYLTTTATPSAPCMRLSLDVYAEYGWYILRRFAMQDQIPCWHSKFAGMLRELLLDSSLADADCEFEYVFHYYYTIKTISYTCVRTLFLSAQP